MQTRRTSSIAGELRSHVSTSTDSTWPSRPSYGATIRGVGGSAAASPLGHAATMPGSQFAAHVADIAAATAAAAASPTSAAVAASGARRGRAGRASRAASRAQAGRDAIEQGQAIIHRVLEAGGLTLLSQEMGNDGVP